MEREVVEAVHGAQLGARCLTEGSMNVPLQLSLSRLANLLDGLTLTTHLQHWSRYQPTGYVGTMIIIVPVRTLQRLVSEVVDAQ